MCSHWEVDVGRFQHKHDNTYSSKLVIPSNDVVYQVLLWVGLQQLKSCQEEFTRI